jgi:hypothetical protein
MRKVIGWLMFLLGAFILGVLLWKTLADEQTLIAPIPDRGAIRVIMLSPAVK